MNYSGLIETVKLMSGLPITTREGQKFASKIIKFLQAKCDFWKKETGLGFCLYSIPSKDLGKYFISIDQEKYGIIKDITDKEYYTNSNYINNLEINIFERLLLEKTIQDSSSANGTTVYIDIPINENIDDLIKFIYENIIYTEFIQKINE